MTIGIYIYNTIERKRKYEYKISKIITQLTKTEKLILTYFDKKENKMNKDEWRDITGYEGRYQVSDKGRVKSLERTFIDKAGHKQHKK